MTGHNITCTATDSRIRYLSGTWIDTNSPQPARLAVDRATVNSEFDGTFISVLGSTAFPNAASDRSSLIYKLDGVVVVSPDEAAPGTILSSQLLPSRRHCLQISKTNNTPLSVYGMIFTRDSASKIPTEVIIAAVLGPLVLVAIILLAFLLYRRRARQLSFSDGPLQASLPSSKAAFTSKKFSNYGISFYSIPSTDNLTRPPPRVKTRPRPQSDWIAVTAATK